MRKASYTSNSQTTVGYTGSQACGEDREVGDSMKQEGLKLRSYHLPLIEEAEKEAISLNKRNTISAIAAIRFLKKHPKSLLFPNPSERKQFPLCSEILSGRTWPDTEYSVV